MSLWSFVPTAAPFAGPAAVRSKSVRHRGGPCRAAGDPKKKPGTKSFFDEADPAVGLQKLWGQTEDVLENKDNLIWNVDWQSQLDAQQRKTDKIIKDKEEAEQKAIDAERLAKPPAAQGFLSMSRSLALDDMNIELESRLAARDAARDAARSTAAASSSSASTSATASTSASASASASAKRAAEDTLFRTKEEYERAGTTVDISMEEALSAFDKAFKKKGNGTQYRYAPTKGERRQWAGSSKFSKGGSKKEYKDAMEGDEEIERIRLEDLANYDRLKQELLIWTLGTSVATAGLVYPLYGQPITISYLFGAFGGVVYLRLLAKSVDATAPGGSASIGGVIEGTVGGQRLLIPAILAAGWNRWNALYAADYGFELQILPILAGFFTYKIATVVQVFRENLAPMMPPRVDEAE